MRSTLVRSVGRPHRTPTALRALTRRVAPLALALAGLASAARASVLVVGPGAYTDLQSAIDAAVDGDLILVRYGSATSLASATIDGKSLVLVADTGKQPKIAGTLRVRNLLPEQDVVVAGISVTGFQSVALELRDNQGSLRFLGGIFAGAYGFNVYGQPGYHPDGYSAAYITRCDDVAFTQSAFLGGAGASVDDWWVEYPTGDGAASVFVRDSHVAFYRCDIEAGAGGSCTDVHDYDGGDGGAAVETPDAFLFLAGCVLEGGFGGFGGDAGAFTQAGSGGTGGDGLRLDGTAQAEAQCLDDAITGGVGGAAGCCGGGFPGADGIPIRVLGGGTVNQIPDVARGLDLAWPQHEQVPATLTFEGAPQDRVILFISSGSGFQFSAPFQGTLLTTTPLIRRLSMGTIDATGTLQAPLTLPPLPAGVEHRTWYLQGLFIDPQGQITLADGTALIILDSAF